MIELSIKKAGELLKLNVPLKGEAKIGLNWKETH
jgi:DNA polymerase I-like protein with 3'-5' exonuclease and polymerase domains